MNKNLNAPKTLCKCGKVNETIDNENKSLIQELTSALKEAKQLTRGYVFLHFGAETKEEWKSIQHFQPMKRINSAIQKGESYGKI